MSQEDRFAEWIFERILVLARNRTVKISVMFKKIQRNKPKKLRKVYFGPIAHSEVIEGSRRYLIVIDPRISERSKIRVFCHELLHILFDVVQSEAAIEKMEHMLWRHLSEGQKQHLRKKMYQRMRKLKNPDD